MGVARFFFGLAVAVAAAGIAFAADPLPQAQSQGDVTFLSGGVSDAEQKAIRERASEYNLWATLARADGAYLSDVAVKVENASGEQVLKTTTKGPALLADLPEGRYTLHASADAWRSEKRTIDIPEDGQTRIFLTFEKAE